MELHLGGGGGGGSRSTKLLGEYCRLNCGCGLSSVKRGLSDRELPAPLSNAGLPRCRLNSLSKLGFLINLLLSLPSPFRDSPCACFKNSIAASKRQPANLRVRNAISSEYPMADSCTNNCR